MYPFGAYSSFKIKKNKNKNKGGKAFKKVKQHVKMS